MHTLMGTQKYIYTDKHKQYLHVHIIYYARQIALFHIIFESILIGVFLTESSKLFHIEGPI